MTLSEHIRKRTVRLVATVLIGAFTVPVCNAKEFYYPAGKNEKAVGLSTDVITIGMPVAALSIILAKKDWNGLLRASLETAGTLGTCYLLKEVVDSERPDHSDDRSFPSLHAATSFLTASFMMRRYGWQFGVPAYALAAYVSWGRIYSKRHDFWDVVAGAAIGTAAGLIFTTPFMKKHNVSVAPSVISTPSPIPQGAPQMQLSLTTTVKF